MAMRSIPIVLMLPSAMVLEVLSAISSMLWEEEEVGEASFSGHSVESGREEILTSSLN